MNAFVAVALFGWIPLSIAAFALFEARIATLLAVIGGWLFLPVASFDLPGVPHYTKPMAVSLGALSGILLFGRRQFTGLRLGLPDLSTLGWCLVPAASSLVNGHGAYDAASALLTRTVDWGIPYLIGRAVFRDLAGAELLAKGLFLGGLAYVPFCLYEVRMSPQLHAMVYGFAQHDFVQSLRLGGYRPMVFMQHGLMVALWMTVAMTAGYTLWRHGGVRNLVQFPVATMLSALSVTTILCKSTGALVLLVVGLAALAAVRVLRNRLPVYALIAVPLLFVSARIGLDWNFRGVAEVLEQFAPDRGRSVEFRIVCEDLVLSQVWERPWLGWSAWGVRHAVADPELGMVALDSAWIITLSSLGLVGLTLFFWVHVGPVLALLRRLSVREWLDPRAAGATALAVGLCLFVCDCMFNAMMNLVYVVVLGSVTSVAARAVPRPQLHRIRTVRRRRGSRRPVPRRPVPRRPVHGLA